MRFEGKVAIVTGGASGIGAATTRLLAREGARVMVADLDGDRAWALAAEIGGTAHALDVADRAAVEALVDAAVAAHGGLDILVNNAGIGSFGRTPDMDPAAWERVIAIDLHAVFYACRAALPHLIAGRGAIVNTASISGLAGDYGFGAYAAAKAGLVNYTRTLALDHARDGVRANALCPGLIDTPLTAGAAAVPGLGERWHDAVPMGRAGTAEEMAAAIAFLASDAASYVTGAVLVADGGMTAWTGQPNLLRAMEGVA
ncbi:SDR family oxidoreductase [Sphingomonas sp. 36D10-4-7]|uniref:SDR family oxidoreductase n=2 Tax=Sphingomonas corticis TaxID=2722791 RepID=A0ABX1CPA4_9SPHN|nr:SDR family oxidoreductase [Sphingomonas corticis]